METLSRLVGAALVLLALADVFFTVLAPGSGRGPLRVPVSRAVWAVFRGLGRRQPAARRRRLLAYAGPTLLVVTFVVWGAVLTTGWALVYLPALGDGLAATDGPTPRDLVTAFYYSGFVVTTLGTGDIVPLDPLHRVLTVVEAAVGFAFFSMVVAYTLSVYGAARRAPRAARRASAATLDHRTGGTGDAVQLVASLGPHGAGADLRSELRATGDFLVGLHESHRAYPVLRTFHYRETRYALPRVLLVALDTVSLLDAALDPEVHGALLRAPDLAVVDRAARLLLDELAPHADVTERPPDEVEEWRRRCLGALGRLRDAGLRVREDDDAVERYVASRRTWAGPLRALADAMLDDWRAIEPRADGPTTGR